MSAQRDTAVEQHDAGLEQFISGYRLLPGIFDEMMDGDGRVRAHWRPFLSMLAALGSDEINRRFAAADRYLRDSGVFYRVYEDAAGIERPWPQGAAGEFGSGASIEPDGGGIENRHSGRVEKEAD